MVLQRYRAKAELGKGSFGTVYLTEGRRDRKTYVVKVVDNLRENNLKVQEIRVMMHLKHRNIVEMVDFYTSNNQLCIVMDYADGGDLRREIVKARNTKVPIPEELIVIWMIQVCQALDYAHEEQIIHRDIKPSNIFLMSDGKSVKVGDFGISKVLDTAVSKDQMAAADTEGRVGTKRYMAPEVLNRQDYSNKADIWSLGCVLFELTTLNHPTYEQDRRIYFEWIPAVYSRNMNELIRACLSEQAVARPSPRELLVKMAGPIITVPGVQQEFLNSMLWFDQQLTNKYRLYEQQSAIVRQFLPQSRITQPSAVTPKDYALSPFTVQAVPPQQETLQQHTPQQPQQPLASPAPRPPPPGGYADASLENFPGTGIVLTIDTSGVMAVSGLVLGGTAEQSRMVEVGDIVHEIDSHNVFRRYASLPHDVLAGNMGTSVRVGLQKTQDPRRLTHIVLYRRATPQPPPPQAQTPSQQASQPQQAHAQSQQQVLGLPRASSPPVEEQQQARAQAPTTENELEHFNIPEYTEEAEATPGGRGEETQPAVQALKSMTQQQQQQQVFQQYQQKQQQQQQQQQLQHHQMLQQQQLQQQQAEQQAREAQAREQAHVQAQAQQQASQQQANGLPQHNNAHQQMPSGIKAVAPNLRYQQASETNVGRSSAPPLQPSGPMYGLHEAPKPHTPQMQPMNMSASFEARPSNPPRAFPSTPDGSRSLMNHDIGRSLDEYKHIVPQSPQSLRSSFEYRPSNPPNANANGQYFGGGSGGAPEWGTQRSVSSGAETYMSSPGRVGQNLRRSGDGSTLFASSGPPLRSSFDGASMRLVHQQQQQAQLAASNQNMGTPTRQKGIDGDTSRVLAELERVRTGIQATLAAAAAAGKVGPGGQRPSNPPSSSSSPPVMKPQQPQAPAGNGIFNPPPQPVQTNGTASRMPRPATEESSSNKYNFAEL